MKLHSVIDIITNSSAEIFVIPNKDIDITVEEVKDIMNELWGLLIDIKKKVDPESFRAWADYHYINEEECVNIKNIMTISKKDLDYDEKYFSRNYDGSQRVETYLKWEAGDIVIESIDDNSIPYELFGFIESSLKARRYHCG